MVVYHNMYMVVEIVLVRVMLCQTLCWEWQSVDLLNALICQIGSLACVLYIICWRLLVASENFT